MTGQAPGELHELNLGAGKTYIPGLVNIDIRDRAELSLDLGRDPLPFPDDSVRTIISSHTLEHVPDYLFALREIHRVLCHDGVLLLQLPYVTLTEWNLVNPYHRHNFSELSFDFFDPAKLKGSAAETGEIAFRKVFVRYNYIGGFGLLPGPLRVWARRHLFNVVRQFDVGVVAIKDPDRPVDTGAARQQAMKRQLRALMARRVPYPAPEDGRPRAPVQASGRRPPLRTRVRGAVWRRMNVRDR